MTCRQRQADELGYEIIVRGPNWSVESGIQAIQSLIEEQPDLLVIQNNDNRSYNRLVQQALAAGIPTIQVQQRVATPSDAYVGPDWYDIGRRTAGALVSACGAGTSGKIAVVEGATASPASMLLQADIPAGSAPFSLISPLLAITKANMMPSSCWTLDELAQMGG